MEGQSLVKGAEISLQKNASIKAMEISKAKAAIQKTKSIIEDKKKAMPKKPDEVALGGGHGASGPVRIHTDPQHRNMTTDEKTRLKQNIGKLTLDQKRGVVPIVQKCVAKNNKNHVIEFELDQLSTECLRELEVYVNKHIRDNVKKQKRKEADRRRRENAQQLKQA
jgi:hypothetical protein